MTLVRQYLSHFPHMNLAIAGQLIFFALFVAALFWVWRSGSKDFYDKLSQLPLEKGNQDERA